MEKVIADRATLNGQQVEVQGILAAPRFDPAVLVAEGCEEQKRAPGVVEASRCAILVEFDEDGNKEEMERLKSKIDLMRRGSSPPVPVVVYGRLERAPVVRPRPDAPELEVLFSSRYGARIWVERVQDQKTP